jgi:(p)ppGpp synthase/HD superfamily hydrolase
LVAQNIDLFDVMKGADKDQLERPKTNGYRSLRTTIIDPGGHTVVFQIRTPWMHALAEWGMAAHWRYKRQYYVH